MKKRIFILFSLFTILCSLSLYAVGVGAVEKIDDDFLALNKEQTKTAREITELMEEKSYPSYFGGIYVSDDSKNVIFQVVKENIPSQTDSENYILFNKIMNYPNVEIEYVENSYKELEEINNQLINYFSSKGADVSNLGIHHIDIYNNIVVVELLDDSPEKILNLKKKIFPNDKVKEISLTSSSIKFIKGQRINNDVAKLEDINSKDLK